MRYSDFQPVVWLGATTLLLITSLASAGDVSLVRALTPVSDSAFGQAICSTPIPQGAQLVTSAPNVNSGRGLLEVHDLVGTEATRIAVLQPTDLTANERFGFAVASHGATIVGASPYAALGKGVVRVFERSGSTIGLPVSIVSPDRANNDYFGQAVAIHGDWLAVGEPFDDLAGPINAGAVHVYRRNAGAWTHAARLIAPAPAAGDSFGYTLATDGATLVISSRYATINGGLQSGAVWAAPLHTDGTVGAAVQVHAPDPNDYEWFGVATAVDGDRMIIGACRDTLATGPGEQGSVRVFARSGDAWTQVQQLVSPSPWYQGRFGNSVWLAGDRLLIGADGEDSGSVLNAGRLHLFRFDASWQYDAGFQLNPEGDQQALGTACALVGNTVFGGAPKFTVDAVAREGAIAVWSLATPCVGDVNGDRVINGLDLGQLITEWDTSGVADLNGDGVVGAADLGLMLAGWGACAP